MKTIWGVSGYAHDSSICVIQNNELKFASSVERYSRIKNDRNFHKDIIEDCLEFGYPDQLVWYENPYTKFLRTAFFDSNFHFKNIKNIFSEHFNINCKVTYCDHHKAHLLSSLLTVPFAIDKTLGVVIDTVGEFKTLSIWNIRSNSDFKLLYKHTYPDSLGLFYSAITDLIGLKPQEDEYILMGMASYGKTEKYYNFFKKYFFKNNHLIFDLRKGARGLFTEKEIENEKYDIALGAQLIYEETFINIITKFLNKLKYRKVILSGGCALNCRANSRLLKQVDNIWTFPNPGDSGAALGAALSINPVPIKIANMFYGYNIGHNTRITEIINILLSEGIVGVMNGRAEFGPRALGNRSILADPRIFNIKDRVNDIKGREAFRPFAPAVLNTYAHKLFDIPNKNVCYEYMQYVIKSKVTNLPGIVHIDGTSRLQVVDEKNIFLYQILSEWYKRTNCPVLLNTSLNIKGKPLLNRLSDIKEFSHNNLKIITP